MNATMPRSSSAAPTSASKAAVSIEAAEASKMFGMSQLWLANISCDFVLGFW